VLSAPALEILESVGDPNAVAAIGSLRRGEGAVSMGRLSLGEHHWLADHVVMGAVAVPGTAFVELAFAPGRGSEIPYTHDLSFLLEIAFEMDSAVPEKVSAARQALGGSDSL